MSIEVTSTAGEFFGKYKWVPPCHMMIRIGYVICFNLRSITKIKSSCRLQIGTLNILSKPKHVDISDAGPISSVQRKPWRLPLDEALTWWRREFLRDVTVTQVEDVGVDMGGGNRSTAGSFCGKTHGNFHKSYDWWRISCLKLQLFFIPEAYCGVFLSLQQSLGILRNMLISDATSQQQVEEWCEDTTSSAGEAHPELSYTLYWRRFGF